jgi:hypothetical protein
MLFTGMFATALIFVMYRMDAHPKVRDIVRFWAIMGCVFWLVAYGLGHAVLLMFA